jgi:hypothetical protein
LPVPASSTAHSIDARSGVRIGNFFCCIATAPLKTRKMDNKKMFGCSSDPMTLWLCLHGMKKSKYLLQIGCDLQVEHRETFSEYVYFRTYAAI